MVSIIDNLTSTNTPFKLTDQQSQALKKLEAFINSPERMFGLYGYAGTGKSTLVFSLIETWQASGKKIVLTSPTNKALTVLKKIANEHKIYVTLCTIHQLLGVAPVRQGTTKVLKQVSPDSLPFYDLVVLDECSMISTELWNIIEEKINFQSLLNLNRKTQLLVMGDPAQLRPVSSDGVNQKRSPSFNIPNKAILTEVVRQRTGSPLLEFVTTCRTAVKSKKVFKPFSKFSPDQKNGSFIVTKKHLLKYALKKFSSTFSQNPDCFRILCYTNERVDYWNNQIREVVYGKNAPKFVIGEKMIAKSPIVAPDGKTTILSTSSEFEIIAIEEDFYAGYKAWNLKVTAGFETKQIYVLHKDAIERFEKDNQRLLKNAKSNPALWKGWYEHNEIFAQIRNCWALTVHNSQGSTFEEVGIDGRDINKKAWGENGNILECNQLWYVSATRAKSRALITIE